MNDQERRLSIAEKVWGAQYRFVGPDNAKNILVKLDAGASPAQLVEEAKGELNMDLGQAVQTLASALVLIQLTIQVYEQLRSALKRAPTDGEVSTAVSEKRPEVIGSLVNWLQKVAEILKQLRA